jgi:hypothetical protein
MSKVEVNRFLDRVRRMPNSELTFLAENLGETLLELLKHPSPVVREGALLGIDNILSEVKDKLIHMVCHDESPGVRDCAKDTWDTLSELFVRQEVQE